MDQSAGSIGNLTQVGATAMGASETSVGQAARPPAGPLPASFPPGAGAPPPKTLQVPMARAVAIATEHFENARRAQAESVCLQILAVDPEQPDALHICGAIAHLAGKHGIALALMEKVARLQPGNAHVLYNLGVVYAALQRDTQAATCFREALQRMPHHRGALQSLGNLALGSDQFVEAQRCYEGALLRAPRDAILHLSLAMVFNAQRQLERAGWFFQRALELAPDNPRIGWESSQYYLLMGEFERGWRSYESRFPAGNECKVWHYPFAYPRWNGQSLAGKHILVHGEQGLGDEIMFLSLVPELLEEGARVTLAGQPHLVPLWRQTFPQCRSYAQARINDDAWTRSPPPWLNELGPVDYQVPCGSLALLRRSDAQDFARQRPYVRPDPEKAAVWRARLDAHFGARSSGRMRVGLVWAGNPSPKLRVARRKDEKRSLALREFAALADVSGVDWVSLQTWEAARQIQEAPPELAIFDVATHLKDFGETAALIQNLDLVISVDTSVCHLAGAMGKPVWILLPFIGEWRWGLDAQRSLWWPSARLFRQERPGDWADVLVRVRRALLADHTNERLSANTIA